MERWNFAQIGLEAMHTNGIRKRGDLMEEKIKEFLKSICKECKNSVTFERDGKIWKSMLQDESGVFYDPCVDCDINPEFFSLANINFDPKEI